MQQSRTPVQHDEDDAMDNSRIDMERRCSDLNEAVLDRSLKQRQQAGLRQA